MRRMLTVLPALLLVGCGLCPTKDDPVPAVYDTSCSGVKPIYISQADELTQGTADQIIGHNKWGQQKCGWKPARKVTH